MITFDLATERDDADICRLLRDNSMPSWVTMTTEREPSFFSGLNRFGRDWAVVARQGRELIGMYTGAEHRVHVNGAHANLGYLGGLRVVPAFRKRHSILRTGYASIPTLSTLDDNNNWYSCIASENHAARRVLEANLKELPKYRYVGELVTLALPQTRGRKISLWHRAQPQQMDDLCAWYNQQAKRYQFAPVLCGETARQTGAEFFIHESNGRIEACMALWGQQAYKQVVARSYRQPLAMLRPAYNAVARLTQRVALPSVGQSLDQTFLAFLSAPQSPLLIDLVRDALALCPTKVLTLGLHAQHPYLDDLQRTFHPLTYRTRIYAVHFAEIPVLDNRPAQPEAAVL